jgi:hypothetical protein
MASGRMLLRPFTSIKAKKKQWYHHVRPSPKSTAASSPTAAGVSGEDEAVSRLTHADSRETHAYSQEDEVRPRAPMDSLPSKRKGFKRNSCARTACDVNIAHASDLSTSGVRRAGVGGDAAAEAARPGDALLRP